MVEDGNFHFIIWWSFEFNISQRYHNEMEKHMLRSFSVIFE